MASVDVIRYELWEDDEGLSFFPDNNDSARRLLGAEARLVWECRAKSWEEAQALKHEHLGWDPYVPLP